MFTKMIAASRLLLLSLVFFSLFVHAVTTCPVCSDASVVCNCEEAYSLLSSLTEYGSSLPSEPNPTGTSSSEDETDSFVVLGEPDPNAAQNTPDQNLPTGGGGPPSHMPVFNRRPEVPPRAFVDLNSMHQSSPSKSLVVNLPDKPQYYSLPQPHRVNLPDAPPPGSGSSTSTGAAGFSRHNPAPLTPAQYASYVVKLSGSVELHAAFAAAQENARESRERGINMRQLQAALTSNGFAGDIAYERASQEYPDVSFDESACKGLRDNFDIILQVSLSQILERRSDVCSLVFPVSNSDITQWVLGEYDSLYDLLFKALREEVENSGNQSLRSELQIFNHYFDTIKSELVAYSNARRGSQVSSGDVWLTGGSDDIRGAQIISESLRHYFPASSSREPVTLAFNFSGNPSPFNQGTVFMIMLPNDSAIIISPYLGILLGQTREAAFEYLVDFALILSINKISEKVTISQWNPSS